MEWLLPPLQSKFALWVFFIILINNVRAQKGCLEEERKGLLEFKELYKGTLVFPPDWVNGDCCQWQKITCNEITGHVIELSFYQWDYPRNSLSLNLSLFVPFKELQRLNLSYMNINGFTETERSLASFYHLEVLDLSHSQVGGSIPSFIWALSSLKAVSLARNEFNGSLPVQAFCELKKLEELDLSNNNLRGTLPKSLSNLTSLRLLDLSGNHFTGNISSSLIPISLEYINLSHNQFEGLFSFSSFANHSKLEVVQFINDNSKFEVETESGDWVPKFQLKILVLSGCNMNDLSGEIPKFLFHQRSLVVLDLSGNKLGGNFPYWLLENNTDLHILYLQRNSFSGLFRPPFSNCSIELIDISDNHFSGRIPTNIGQVFPRLYHLNLSRNAFHNRVPSSITNMSYLLHLDLSVNNFSGEFPTRVVTGCRYIGVLILSDNKFHGELPLTLSNSTDVWGSLYVLDISNNFLSGEIPSWIRNVNSLETLALQNNLFDGQLPSVLARDFIDASNNFLSGSLPLVTRNEHLKQLHLQGNRFTGSIPESYLNLSRLLTLDLSENSLSGSIPNFVGALSNLRILLLRGNHLTGSIPNQLCHLRNISLMDLSSNSLSGAIPNCFPNITGPNNLAFQLIVSVRYILRIYASRIILEKAFTYEYSNIFFKIEEVYFVTKNRPSSYKGGILDFMSGLDFSCNNLTGEIPNQLGMLVQVRALNLSHNQLTGCIPKLFSHLANVESMDLSFNRLSGEIPSELIDLNFLEVFIVAHNNLSGRVPEMKGQFGSFPKSYFEGNPFLCGPQVEKNCTTLVPSSLPNASSSDESEDKWYDIDLLFFSASFVGTYFVFLLGVVTLLYLNPHWRRRWFNFVEECMYSCYYFLCDSLQGRVRYSSQEIMLRRKLEEQAELEHAIEYEGRRLNREQLQNKMTAIKEMAGMDVLCSEKTGTLSLNKLGVERGCK